MDFRKKEIAFDLNDFIRNQVKEQVAIIGDQITMDAEREPPIPKWMSLSSKPSFSASSRFAPFFGFVMWLYVALGASVGGWTHSCFTYAFAIASLGSCRLEKASWWTARLVMVLCLYGIMVNFVEAMDRHEVRLPWASKQRVDFPWASRQP